MPFMDFSDEGSAIVGRLVIEIPENADQTMSQVKNAVSDIKTELEATSRFMKNFTEYLEKIPQIAKITAQFQEQELSFLRKKLELESQISDAQNRGVGGGRGRGRGRGVQTDHRGNVNVDTDGEHERREEENRRTQGQFPQFSGELPRSGRLLRDQHWDVKYGDLTNSQSWASFAGTLPQDLPFSGTLRPSSEIPVSPMMQSMLDYRQRIGQELDDPRVLFEHLRQRGMVTEGIAGGAPSYTVQIGGKRFSADELMTNPQLQSFALDHLARMSAPLGNENGASWRQMRAVGFNALNAMRMLGPGTTIGQNIGGVGNLLGSVGRLAGGIGLGSLGTGLLVGGGALGIGAGILGAVEEGGQMYQNVKNIGQLHNQGFSGGFGYEMGMRMMALNPFITTEQARQIMMGGLTLGYTGKEFDTVTEFMASNLKDMNLQVSDSVKLVQQNVQQGSQSIGGLASQLNLLQQLSGTSSQTNQQAQQKFIQTSGSLINQGVSGQVSGEVATELGQWFQQPIGGQVDPLAQIGGQLTNQAINSPQFQQQMIALGLVPPNTLPQEAVQASGANLPQNLQKVFQFYASQAAAGGAHAPVLFQQMLAAAGVQLNLTQATQLYGRMVGPNTNLPTTRANQAISQAESTTLNQALLARQRGDTNSFSTILHDTGNFFADIVGQGEGGWSKNPTQQRMDSDAATAAAGKYSNPILNQLVQQYGAGDLVVYDPQGNPHKIDYNNQAMMMGIGNGSWKIAFARTEAEKKAMEGSPQQWAAGARALGAAGNEGTLNQWANNEVQTNKGAVGLIGLTPDAQKLITFLPNQGNVPNDPGTIAANAGLNGAQPNNNPFTPFGNY